MTRHLIIILVLLAMCNKCYCSTAKQDLLDVIGDVAAKMNANYVYRTTRYSFYNVEDVTVKNLGITTFRFRGYVLTWSCDSNFTSLSLSCKLEETSPLRSCDFVAYFAAISGRPLLLMHRAKHCIVADIAKLHSNYRVMGLTLQEDLTKEFENFKVRYNKTFPLQQDRYRYLVFRENYMKAMVLQHLDQGTAHYGITPFSHLSEHEFHKIYLPTLWDQSKYSKRPINGHPEQLIAPSFDWREKGAVSEVKNQGMCGSCWAFSVTGNIEGQWFLQKKNLVSLSEQQLVDCDKLDAGCNGGLPMQAYTAIEGMGGLETEKDYSYVGKDEKCHLEKAKIAVYINDSVVLPDDETKLANWLVKNGPFSIGLNALPLQFYMYGIVHLPFFLCPSFLIDHGVLIVGYGTGPTIFHSDIPYWIVKNSWGSTWGESGYFRIYRGSGTCGLNTMCSSAIVK